MRVLIAPDKFKGTLTAQQAADAISRGVERAAKRRKIDIETDLCPVADGGEGTAAIVEHALRGRGAFVMEVPAKDLLGAPVIAKIVRWKNADGAYTTLIESAQVIGLARVPEEQRDPTAYDTGALGELIRATSEDAPGDLIISLGGSATVDGGVGLARTMGRRPGKPDASARRQSAGVIVLCDVDNPLLGAHGAARVYGPQKGATEAQVEELERGLAHLVELCRRAGVECDPEAPGAGAAGGLGFGLAAFLGGRLVPGAEYLLDLIGFGERAARADVVMTGEGRLDAQTASRKAPMEVARRAKERGKPVLAVVGRAEEGAPVDAFDSVTACADDGSDAAARLTDAGERAFTGWLEERDGSRRA